MSLRAESIKKKVMEAFSPAQFRLENESHLHSGPRTESHFKIFLVSEAFKGVSRIDRQRMVNECLKQEFEAGLHALTMRLKTPDEDQKTQSSTFTSPDCTSKK